MTEASKFLPDHGYIVWVPAGHIFFTCPAPTVVEPDEEPNDGASAD